MAPKASDVVYNCFVADAATMPLHWIYDVSKINSLLTKDGSAPLSPTPEYFDPPSCPFYNSTQFPGHYELGQNSPNGETGFIMLEYLKSTGGKFTGGEALATFQYNWAKSYTGRKDHPTTDMEKAYVELQKAGEVVYPKCGVDDHQAYLTFKVPQIYMKFGNKAEQEYLTIIEESVRTLQNSDQAVCYAKAFGLMLRSIMEGASFEEALEKVISTEDKVLDSTADLTFAKQLKDNINLAKESIQKVSPTAYNEGLDQDSGLASKLIAKFNLEGQGKLGALSCAYPFAFIAGVAIVGDTLASLGAGTAEFKANGLAFAVRRNIYYGGDSAGRGWLINSLVSALGAELPADWSSKYAKADEVKALIDSVGSF